MTGVEDEEDGSAVQGEAGPRRRPARREGGVRPQEGGALDAAQQRHLAAAAQHGQQPVVAAEPQAAHRPRRFPGADALAAQGVDDANLAALDLPRGVCARAHADKHEDAVTSGLHASRFGDPVEGQDGGDWRTIGRIPQVGLVLWPIACYLQ